MTRFMLPFFIVTVVFFFLLHTFLLSDYNTDDAYISFRYARNLAEGHGLTFNPGERVEGYTNFLWTVLIAMFYRLRLEPLFTARLLSISGVLILLLLLIQWQKKRYSGTPLELPLVAAMIAANSGIALWSVGGLETVFFMLLITIPFLLLFERNPSSAMFRFAGFIAALAALTRPEGLYFAAFIAVGILIFHRPKASASLLRFAIPLLLVFGTYYCWRYSYFGYPLPNTFYAKTGGGMAMVRSGILYLWDHARTVLFLPYLLALPAVRHRRRNRFYLTAILGYIGYVIIIGGDWMPFHRFLVPILPLLFILDMEALHGLFVARNTYRPGRAVTLALLVTILIAGQLQPSLPLLVTSSRVTGGKEEDILVSMGRWLQINARPGAAIAVVAAGKIPYYSNLYTIDMRGLLDLHIAHLPNPGDGLAGHEKKDPDYIMSRQPDYIITSGATLKTDFDINHRKRHQAFTPVVDSFPILRHPSFESNYRRIVIQQQGSKNLLLYRRRTLEKLDAVH